MLVSNISADDDTHYSETTRINNQSVTAPSVHIMLGDDDAQLFKTPIKNHSVNAPSAQNFWGSGLLKFQHKNITHRSGQKLPPS